MSALLDGQPYTLGTPVTAEGPHTLAVAAIDQAGNLGQAEVSFTIATQPPTISITGVTQGATVHGPVALSFSVSGTQPITATATIDGAPFTTGSLVSSEGPHSFVVSSVDAAGNHATASRTFTIDTIAPVITLGGVIEGTLYAHAVSPTFAVSDLHLSSVSASLDGSPFSSGASVGTDGHHTLLVVASDEAGNSSQAEVHFTIDRTAPVVAIGGVAQGASVSGSVTPSFTVTDANAYTLTVTLDGSPFSPGPLSPRKGRTPWCHGDRRSRQRGHRQPLLRHRSHRPHHHHHRSHRGRGHLERDAGGDGHGRLGRHHHHHLERPTLQLRDDGGGDRAVHAGGVGHRRGGQHGLGDGALRGGLDAADLRLCGLRVRDADAPRQRVGEPRRRRDRDGVRGGPRRHLAAEQRAGAG